MRVLIIESHPGAAPEIGRALETNAAFVTQTVRISDMSPQSLTAMATDAIIIDAPADWARNIILHLRQAQDVVPIMAIGLAEDRASVVALLESGADDYIARPWQADELLSRVIALIRRSRGYATSTVEIGDLTLDMSRGYVLKAGLRIDLAPFEYRLLEYLALRRGQLIPAHEIAAGVFGTDPLPDEVAIGESVAIMCRKIGNDTDSVIRSYGTDGYKICSQQPDLSQLQNQRSSAQSRIVISGTS